MSRRSQWGTLAERTDATRSGSSPEKQPPAPPAASADPVVKPCWVTDRHGRQPGLLLQWRRTDSGYLGRVVRPVLEADGWIVVEDWLPAELLEPAARDPRG